MDLLQKAQRIQQLSSQLGLIIPVPFLHIEHRDKNGNLYPDGDYYNVSQSWVRNAYNHFISRLGGTYPDDADPNWGTGYINYKDTGGTIRSGSVLASYGGTGTDETSSLESASIFYFRAANSSASGIVVGTGVGAESFEDYTLGAIVAHGTGSGQLSYGVTAVSESDNGLIHKASWSRVLTHGGSGQPNVVVGEVGIYARLYLGAERIIMFLRDVGGDLPKTMTYLDTLTVTYEITLTYPS